MINDPRLFSILLIVALLSEGCNKTAISDRINKNPVATTQSTQVKKQFSPLDIAATLEKKANTQFLVRDYANASVLYMQAFNIRKKELGLMHPSLINDLYNLATINEVNQLYEKAETKYRLAINILKLHKQHRNANIYLGYLTALQYLKSSTHTKKELNNILLAYKQLHDPNNIRASAVHHQLANNYLKSKNYQASELAFKNAMRVCRLYTGIEHPYYTLILRDYTKLLQLTQRNQQATQLIDKITSILSHFPKKLHVKLYQLDLV